MEVKHIFDNRGEALTEVLYQQDNQSCTARLPGVLSAEQAAAELTHRRRVADRVVYVRH